MNLPIPTPAALIPAVPTLYARNVIGALRSLNVVGDATQHDVAGILESPAAFLRQIREKGETQLQALKRVDTLINGNLEEARLPMGRRTMIGASFFSPGGTAVKVPRYVSMIGQYASSLPTLLQASAVLEERHEDRRAPVAACIHYAEKLLGENLHFPAFDLFELGILETHAATLEAGRDLSKSLRPIQSFFYIMHSIAHSSLEREPAAVLLLSLLVASQPLTTVGREVVGNGLLMALSAFGLVHPALISPQQLKEAAHFSKLLGIPPELLPERDLQIFADLAMKAVDGLKFEP
ncbi:MAG TPA: hypothetical protein VFX30_11045 [bacterium]|nr:hypothetical protein [bacterium]